LKNLSVLLPRLSRWFGLLVGLTALPTAALAAGTLLYLHNTTATGLFKLMSSSAPAGGGVNASTSNCPDFEVADFATAAYPGGLSIPAGNWTFNLWTQVTTGAADYQVQVWDVNSFGTLTNFYFTSNSPPSPSGPPSTLHSWSVARGLTNIPAGYRLALLVYMRGSSCPSAYFEQMDYDGVGAASNLDIPLPPPTATPTITPTFSPTPTKTYLPNAGTDWTLACCAAFGPHSFAAVTQHDDGSGLKLWMVGGHNQSLDLNEVWNSNDAIHWNFVGNAPWQGRSGMGLVSFNGELWMVGGDGPFGYTSEVWHSADGVTWTQVTSPAVPFPNRTGAGVLVFNNKLWVIGGFGSATCQNDIWSSVDGTNWVQAVASAPFSPREARGATVFNGEMWVISGSDCTTFGDDVWHSADGVNWFQSASGQSWNRAIGAVLPYQGRLWVIGGWAWGDPIGDVWSSADGASWVQNSPTSAFGVRAGMASAVWNDEMWLFGGEDSSSVVGDTWYSPLAGTVTPAPACTATITPTFSMSPTPITAQCVQSDDFSGASLAPFWIGADIGTSGGSESTGGALTINTYGSDIWFSSDEFHYVYQPVQGDMDISLQINEVPATDAWAKAGLMFRENAGADSAFFMIAATLSNNYSLLYRSSPAGAADCGVTCSFGSFTNFTPGYVRLQRTGNDFYAYTSTDGVAWTLVGGPFNIPMNTTFLVGAAATAHSGSLGTAQFGNFTVLTGACVSTPSPTPTPSFTPTRSASPTNTITASQSPSPTPTWTATPSATPSVTPSPTVVFNNNTCSTAIWGNCAYHVDTDSVDWKPGHQVYVGGAIQGTSPQTPTLIKLDEYGNLLWSLIYNDGSNKIGTGAASDAADNAYLSAWSNGGLPGEQFVLIKVDAGGNTQWTKGYWDGIRWDRSSGVAVDSAGNIIQCGYSEPFGGGSSYALTVKYDSSGNTLWARTFGSSAEGDSHVVTDAANNIYVSGWSAGSLLLLKYDPAGALQFSPTFFTGGGNGAATSVALDSLGNIYESGYSDDGVGGSEWLTLKYNSAGALVWSRAWTGPGPAGSNHANAIAVGQDGGVYVGGDRYSVTNWVLKKYDTLGNDLWTIQENAGNGGTVAGIAVNAASPAGLMVAGGFSSACFRNENQVLHLELTCPPAATATPTWTVSPTRTPSPSLTDTPTASPSASSTLTPSPSSTASPSFSATYTQTRTATVTPTPTSTALPCVINLYAGSGGSFADGVPATSSTLNFSEKIARDSAGNLYIADSSNQRVRKINAATGIITTVIGTGTAGSAGDGGQGTAAQLNVPAGVVVDPTGTTLYASEFNGQRVRALNLGTGVITTVAGTGASGYSGDGGLATSGQISGPKGLAMDGLNNLYFAEFNNHVIRKVNLNTGIISRLAGVAQTGGFNGDCSSAVCAELNNPTDVAYWGATNSLYICDKINNRIRKVDLISGTLSTVAGTGVAGSAGDNGLATSAQLNLPEGIGLDPSGNLLVSDTAGNKVRKIDYLSQVITTAAGTGVPGSGGNGGAANSATLNKPDGMAVDPVGNLFVVELDTGSGAARVREIYACFPQPGTPTPVGTPTNTPTATATPVNCTIARYAGSGPIYSDNCQAVQTTLNFSEKIARDPAGNLYIADTSNHRVRKINAVTGIITTVIGTGVGGGAGDGGQGTAAQIDTPAGVVVDPTGTTLYASEFNGQRIRALNLGTGVITRVAGTGASG
jgi:sugar lactone lactonase YvrE